MPNDPTGAGPNVGEQAGSTGDDVIGLEPRRQRFARQKFFGTHFPTDLKSGKQWRRWIDSVLKQQEPTMRNKRLYWTRNRHFFQGRQWISSRDGTTWRELDADQNHVRMVMNVFKPALAFRRGIITEQRPGFKTHPLGTGLHGREVAEAQQNVAEYYYNKLNGRRLIGDATYNAQLDGVSFLHVFIDKNAGPKHEDLELIGPDDERFFKLEAQGYKINGDGLLELPTNADGNPMAPGLQSRRTSLGDIGTRIVLAHEVFFDAEAKSVNGPYDRAKWCIIRRIRDVESAQLETGKKDLQVETAARTTDPILDASDVTGNPNVAFGFQRGLPPYPTTRHQRHKGIFEFLVFIAPSEEAGFPDGIWARLIGSTMVGDGEELPGHKIPLARLTDGSPDPEMFPMPDASDWVADQMTINALVSKLIEHVRSGQGRLLAHTGTIIKETYSEIIGSLLTYRGTAPQWLSNSNMPRGTWDSLQWYFARYEDKTGWNAMARGQVTGSGGFQDVSGRALLAAGERFERQFGPPIRAAADGMSEWSVLIVDHARWLFDVPRLIPMAGRPDLAKRLASEDLGEESVVYVDSETLIPMPRALRNQMLFDSLEQGLITPEEFRRRSPFADIRNLNMGDTEHWERAQLVNTVLEEKFEELAGVPDRYDPDAGGLAIWWQDNPEVHKRALEEALLDESKPLLLRDLVAERWSLYDMLERSKTFGPEVAPPPPQVRAVPADLIPPPPEAMPPEGGGQMPGADFQAISPTPGMGPAGPSEASQLAPTALGEFGASEAAAQQLQQA